MVYYGPFLRWDDILPQVVMWADGGQIQGWRVALIEEEGRYVVASFDDKGRCMNAIPFGADGEEAQDFFRNLGMKVVTGGENNPRVYQEGL